MARDHVELGSVFSVVDSAVILEHDMECGGADLRVVCIDGTALAAMQRQARRGEL